MIVKLNFVVGVIYTNELLSKKLETSIDASHELALTTASKSEKAPVTDIASMKPVNS